MHLLERFFNLRLAGTNLRTEVLAGATTFLTAAYIIFVNPDILAKAGMDRHALVVVTCLVSGLGTLLFALVAKVPMMMAPGMGLNAFFTFTIVLGQGVSWRTALGIVFVSGVLFLILTLIGVREKIIHSIPPHLRFATSIGIGVFIAFIGLQNLGLIKDNPATLVQLGRIDLPALLGLGGLVLTALLTARRVTGAILWGILATTVTGLALGLVSLPTTWLDLRPDITPIAFELDIPGALRLGLLANILAFMYVDLFDSLGTMLAVANQAGMVKNGKIEKIGSMLTCDAVATVGGALLGTSTTTTYLESACGIAVGGRTGLTALVTAALFLFAIPLAPALAIVPGFATAPALIVVGSLMMAEVRQLDFSRIELALPAFLTMILMPLTYSIATGIMFGFLAHVCIFALIGKARELNPTVLVIAAFSLLNLVLGQG
ncbi:MAG: guanine permease [Deltaproteobacteria bacterium RIFOXYA12_FULL_61_11]|nr:MAG: guanine permease [Deltaproteobacteria bacterium RIFOXYA12_FULL_61_11]